MRQSEDVRWRSGAAGDAHKPRWQQTQPDQWRPLAEVFEENRANFSRNEDTEIGEKAGEIFKQAYKEGIQKAKNTVEAIMDRYHNTIGELGLLRTDIINSSEQSLVELALHIAGAVIENDDESRTEFTLKMAQEALQLLKEADRISLRVGPTDVRAIHEHFPDLLSEESGVQIIEDEDLNLGGVVAESHLGVVDASVKKKLDDVAEQARAILTARTVPQSVGGSDDAASSSHQEVG